MSSPEHREPHLPLPVELPLVDEPGGTDVDLKTQIVRFVLSGGFSGIVDFGGLLILMHFGLSHTVAKSISYIAGTTTAYLINRRWTFQAPPSKVRFTAVLVLYATTFAVQVGIFDVLFTHLPPGVVSTFFAYVVAQGTATVINFVVQRAVIFKLR